MTGILSTHDRIMELNLITLHFRPTLRGVVKLPSSKSISNRVLAINYLAGGGYDLHRLAVCDDTTAMRQALTSKGDEINIGAAGTAMRFATAILALTPGRRLLTGSLRMQQRPIHPLVEALTALGASISYAGNEGFPPLVIRGKALKGGAAEIPATISSQYISALLLIAPLLEEGLRLHLKGELISRPYVEQTLALMRRFGAKCHWEDDGQTIYVAPRAYDDAASFTCEADWSAASYWYSLMALSQDDEATLLLEGLTEESLQGDSRVKDLFVPLGVTTRFTETGAVISKSKPALNGTLTLDLTEQPDLAQTMVVTACLMGVPFRISGLQSLRIKETDRIAALQTELLKLGYRLNEEEDGVLSWYGEGEEALRCAAIDTYDDHRMAMAFAVAGMTHPCLTIRNPQVVSKSYPDFWEHLQPFLL